MSPENKKIKLNEPELSIREKAINQRAQRGDTLGVYLNEISNWPLLTREEEQSIFKTIENGHKAREILAQNSHNEEGRNSLSEAIQKGNEAWNQLLNSNLGLVVSIAKRYQGRGVAFLQLISEGNVGLMRASKKFEWRRGHKFSTYATAWIEQHIQREVINFGKTIRTTVDVYEKTGKVMKAQELFKQKHGHDPTLEELAEETGFEISKITIYLRFAENPLSLESSIFEDPYENLGDSLVDESSPDPSMITEQNILAERLHQLLEELPARDAMILKRQNGFFDEPSTLKDISERFALSVRQIERIAKIASARLKANALRENLDEFLEE